MKFGPGQGQPETVLSPVAISLLHRCCLGDGREAKRALIAGSSSDA